jgi:hypothetical protein
MSLPGFVSRARRVAAAWAAAAALAAPTPADPATSKPPYLQPFTDGDFGTRVLRVTGDPGDSITAIDGGVWGRDTRHVYSKQEPWSADERLFYVENREGGKPSALILDGATFRPLRALCDESVLYDSRWHPSRRHARERIGVDRAGLHLVWMDVLACRVTRSWDLPFAVDGFGSGEGNASADGRFVVLGKGTRLFVVDMDPRPPFAPYPARRIGPVYTLPDPGFGHDMPVDNISVSASGRYVDVNYAGDTPETEDVHRILEIDPRTLALRPHEMASDSPRCGPAADRTDGWILPLKHADMTLDPDGGNADVMVGGLACPGLRMGHVVKVRLEDGRATALTDPDREASVSHVSARSLERPGWVYVTYFVDPDKRGDDEIVSVPLDGSRRVEEWTRTRTLAHGCYRCEAHAVPSPDGRRVAFASNWGSPNGKENGIEDYVVSRP